MIKIEFPDGSKKEFKKGINSYEIAKSISSGLANKAVGAKFNDNFIDLFYPLFNDGKIQILTKTDPDSLYILNHSTAHLMAQAIRSLYPNTHFGVGPSILEGFYYDIDFYDKQITINDLEKIEKEMHKLANLNQKIVRTEITYEEALKIFANDPYKLELINEHKNEKLSIYRQGNFVDLCSGGHVTNTKEIKHFKLLNLAGAYWRGNSNNKQLTRIYGTSFWKEKDLNEHLELLEERKKRDHRKIGKELELFMFSEYGPGFPFWLPNGIKLKRKLIDFWYEVHEKENYLFIETPQMLNQELWETSGHWKNYKENMYLSEIDNKKFAIKPMNCPGGMLVYKDSLHSYRDLPLRVGELGHVHRHEASGALNGLFRVRAFTQDDAHIFMTPEQIEEEIINLLNLFDKIYSVFDLKYTIELSTRPKDKFIGDINLWNKAEEALAKAMKKSKREYKINPGDGAFYGPKLDFKIKDSMNRIWQCGTIQLDMNLPERFDLTYIDENGEKQRPVMLHRAIFGSLERFIGILIEHYAGKFPTWLAPNQVVIIPVNNKYHLKYATKLKERFEKQNIETTLDEREEKLGYKIRESQLKKIPYQLVVGDNEVKNKTLTYRLQGEQKQTTTKTTDFIKLIKKEIKERN